MKSDPFEYAALEWWKLDSDKLGSVSLERFNHYCDIVNAFKKILGATAFLENVDLKEILPQTGQSRKCQLRTRMMTR